MKKLLSSTIFFLIFISLSYSQEIMPQTIIFKAKNNKLKTRDWEDYLQKHYQIKIKQIQKVFPYSKSPKQTIDKYGNKLVDISTIYKITIKEKGNEIKLANKISLDPNIIYSEPYYLPQPCYMPNDPKISFQYYLNKLNTFAAWDIFKGDTSVTVGIVDMGIDLNHEDLQNKIAYNYNDPIDGIDNDNDGYVDNFMGWDLGDNDNNPQWNEAGTEGENDHGCLVAGTGFAEPDNNTGIAGVGFNVRFLPVKISNSQGVLNKTYEGIIYAAQHGCKIINCSWGSTYYSQYSQDIINYVTNNLHCLVVAAAGNYGNNIPFYPASYDNVISVAGTNNNDNKWNHSSYGIFVDVCAPGEAVLTTWANNNYSNGWGTSFASPQVAAAAALVDEYYGDTLLPWQIEAILKHTARNIDTVQGNENLVGLLGHGVIDLYKALTQPLPPAVVVQNVSVKNQNGDTAHFLSGDTLMFSVKLINYMTATSHLYLKVSCNSPYIQILPSDSAFIGTLNQYSTYESGFTFRAKVSNDAPFDFISDFKFLFADTSLDYYDYKYKRLFLNDSYLNIYPNNIKTTVTSYGRNGFNRFTPVQGLGFLFENYNESLYYESGYMIGMPNKVCDAVRGQNDFSVLSAADSTGAEYTPYYYTSAFNDNNADTNKMGIKVYQDVWAIDTPTLNNVLFYTINITNDTIVPLDSVFFGIFTDWDLADYSYNFANFDVANQIAYTYCPSSDNLYAGIKILHTTQPIHCYSFDNTTSAENQIIIADGYSKAEKFASMTNNHYQAGGSTGNDVAQTISTGPFHISQNDTVTIAFAYIAAHSLNDLQNYAANAQEMYNSLTYNKEITNNQKEIKIYPNPSSQGIFKINDNQNYKIEVFNTQGLCILKTLGNKINLKHYTTGTYIVKITNPRTNKSEKFVLIRQ